CGDGTARRLHFGQPAEQADRDQPQRHDSPGGAGPAAARRRAADPAEPRSLPDADHSNAADSGEALMRKHWVQLLAMLLIAGGAGRAAAQEAPLVSGARSAGLIGERFDGYIGFVTAPTAELRRQVGAINIRRRSLYTGLANRRGVTPQEVGI